MKKKQKKRQGGSTVVESNQNCASPGSAVSPVGLPRGRAVKWDAECKAVLAPQSFVGSSHPECPSPPSSLLWPHSSGFLVYLISITRSHSSKLGLKSTFMWGLFWTTKPSPHPWFLFFVACVNLPFCILWYNSIYLSILDYKLTEGRNSIFSFSGGFVMVSDKKTAALTKFKNGALRTIGIMEVCTVCSDGI